MMDFGSKSILFFLAIFCVVLIEPTESALTPSRTSFRYQLPYDYYNSNNYNNYYRDYYDRYYNRDRGADRRYYDRNDNYDRNNYYDRNSYDRYRDRDYYDRYYDRYNYYDRNRYDRDRYDRDRYNPDSRTRYIGPDTFPGKFLGNGKVNLLYGGRDAELICTLSTGGGSDMVSNAVWSKIEGAYPYSDNPTYKNLDFDDVRFSHHIFQGSAVILIRDVRPADFGVYRCVGTAHTGDQKETVFQIVEFFRN